MMITNSDYTLTSINGRTEIHEDVLGLEIRSHREKIKIFPHGIDKLLPNLESIEIFDSALLTIKQSDLKPFKNLTHLILTHNEIEIIPDNLFAFNPEMKEIDFSSNDNLRAVGLNAIPIGLESAKFFNAGCLSTHLGNLTHLRAKAQDNCSRPEKLMKSLFGEEFEALEVKVSELKDKLHENKVKINALEQVVKELSEKKTIKKESFRVGN